MFIAASVAQVRDVLQLSSVEATKLAAIAAFATSALACLIAAWRAKGGTRTWRRLTYVYTGLVAEMFTGLRYTLHDQFAHMLMSAGDYGARRGPQTVLVGALLLVFGVCAVRILRSGRGIEERLALVATFAILTLFASEILSLHGWDALMYRSAFGMMIIGWLWVGFALVVMSSALRGATGQAHRRRLG